MTYHIPNEILEKIFHHLSWVDLSTFQKVCKRWNTIIEEVIKVRRRKIERSLINISNDSRLLFTGNGISLISRKSRVYVVEDNTSWILKINDQSALVSLGAMTKSQDAIVSGQSTEDIIVIETSGHRKNALEIWNRKSRSPLSRIELEDQKSRGIYRCFGSTVMIFNSQSWAKQFSSVEINTTNGEIIEKNNYEIKWNYNMQLDFPQVIEIVFASPSYALITYYRPGPFHKLLLGFFDIDQNKRKMTQQRQDTIGNDEQEVQVKIMDHFIITQHQQDIEGNLNLTVYDFEREKCRCPGMELKENRVVTFHIPTSLSRNRISRENCVLDYHEGNLIFTISNRILVFHLESLSGAYKLPTTIWQNMWSYIKDGQKSCHFKSKILEIKSATYFECRQTCGGRTSITTLYFPELRIPLHLIPVVSKKLYFWA